MCKFIILFSLLLFSYSAIAQETNDDKINIGLGKLGSDLVSCGGAMITLSALMSDEGNMHTAKRLENEGRGYFVSGAFLKYTSGEMTEFNKALTWAENEAYNEKTNWLSKIETEDSNLSSSFKEKLKNCNELAAIQSAITKEMKKIIYQ